LYNGIYRYRIIKEGGRPKKGVERKTDRSTLVAQVGEARIGTGLKIMGFRVREHDMEIMKRKEGIWRPSESDSVEECFLADDRLVTRTGPGYRYHRVLGDNDN